MPSKPNLLLPAEAVASPKATTITSATVMMMDWMKSVVLAARKPPITQYRQMTAAQISIALM